MRKTIQFLFVALLLVSLLAACGGGGPRGVAKEWTEAMTTGDGATGLKLTCREYWEQVQMSSLFTASFGLLAGVDTTTAEVDMDDLTFETISQDGDRAVVRVEGTMFVSILGAAMPQDVYMNLELIKEDGDWVVCGGW